MVAQKYDEVGYWSEIKLDIIREYASAYSRILNAQTDPWFYHCYIDAFAGAGKHISKRTNEFIPGSPTNALLVNPPFREYHFIDLDDIKIESLLEIAGTRNDVFIYPGDCNRILLDKVFPRMKWEEYKRALCVLDPYGLHLDWEVIAVSAKMNTIEIFLNFPIYDMNLNVLRHHRDGVSEAQMKRMDRYWGNDSWKKVAYKESPQTNLFEFSTEEKGPNVALADAFRERLKSVAGFFHVPKPMPMRNTKNAIVYYLFFASHNPVAGHIVESIFNKYQGMRY